MLVYRVEHAKHGHGPYRSSEMVNEGCVKLSKELMDAFSLDTHPVPCLDGIHDLDSEEYCGFESLYQLHDWFGRYLQDLHIAGYHVAVFDVPENTVRKGNKQVVFRRMKEEPVFTRTLIKKIAPLEAELCTA